MSDNNSIYNHQQLFYVLFTPYVTQTNFQASGQLFANTLFATNARYVASDCSLLGSSTRQWQGNCFATCTLSTSTHRHQTSGETVVVLIGLTNAPRHPDPLGIDSCKSFQKKCELKVGPNIQCMQVYIPKKLSSLEKNVGKYASSIECTWVLVTVSS